MTTTNAKQTMKTMTRTKAKHKMKTMQILCPNGTSTTNIHFNILNNIDKKGGKKAMTTINMEIQWKS